MKIKTFFVLFALFASISFYSFAKGFQVSPMYTFLEREQENIMSTAVLGINNEPSELFINSEIIELDDSNPERIKIIYEFEIENRGEYSIYDLLATNDLAQTFNPHNFNLISISSPTLLINENYNGQDDTQMLGSNNQIASNSKQKITIIAEFNPENDLGPFENHVEVSGTYDAPADNDSDNTNNNNQENSSNNNANGNGNGNNNENNSGNANNNNSNGNNNPNNGNNDNPNQNDNSENTLPPQVDFEPRDIQLILINTDTGEIITNITNGMTLNLDELPEHIAVLADVRPIENGSIIFGVNNNPNFQTENYSPYALNGNNGNQYDVWEIQPEEYTIDVTAYSGQYGTGEVLGLENYNITFEGTPRDYSSNIDSNSNVEESIDLESNNNETESNSENSSNSVQANTVATSESASVAFTLVLGTNTNNSTIEQTEDEDKTAQEQESPINNIPNTTLEVVETADSTDTIEEIRDGEYDLPSETTIQKQIEYFYEVTQQVNSDEGKITDISVSDFTPAQESSTLANTGFGLTDTLFIGSLLIIGVIQLNSFGIENKLRKKLLKIVRR